MHQRGFRAYWRRKSRPKGGRPRIDQQVQNLIRDVWRANPTWGKPRVQAELRKIGIEVSDCPDPRSVGPPEVGNVVALAQVGGLHHRYTRRFAA